MTQGWTTVFTGPLSEAVVVRSKLEARGIPVFMPGETMRQMGLLGDFGVELALDPSLQVPPSAVDVALTCIGAPDANADIRADEQELPADFFSPDPESQADAEVKQRARRLSRCIVFGAIFPLGAPFALWNLVPYLKTAELLEQRPRFHRMTIAAACLSPLNFLPVVLQFYM